MSEVIANTPTPGTPAPQTTLAGNGGSITAAAATMLSASAPAAALQGAGNQFRILIDSEIILASYSSGTWTLITRGVEGSTAAAHNDGAAVYHVFTAAGLPAAVLANPTFTGATATLSPGMNLVNRWNYRAAAANIAANDGDHIYVLALGVTVVLPAPVNGAEIVVTNNATGGSATALVSTGGPTTIVNSSGTITVSSITLQLNNRVRFLAAMGNWWMIGGWGPQVTGVDRGATTINFPATASVSSNSLTVNHSLGITPISVVATCGGTGGVFMMVSSMNASSFVAVAYYPFNGGNGTTAQNVPFTWVACA